ncbi:tetratricopeptide repeat protein [Myxococcota bacterium]|nr:tetratricopeptide repeat protein [Myxococcota bacterium]MBU1379650.1 tetratricopeptide repeat protein [Myxococcota bacterium]MBU1497993.1 tetratricopeptide repeat protein [Myxococcota bacterium]
MIKEIKTLAANLLRTPSDQELLTEFTEALKSAEGSSSEKVDFILKNYKKAFDVRLYILGHELLRTGLEIDPDNSELLKTMAELLDNQLWLGNEALEAYKKLAVLSPEDTDSSERAESLELEAQNWEKLLDKYMSEADGSTEPELIGHMYFRAAEVAAKYGDEQAFVEDLLLKAHDADPENAEVSLHLEHFYRINKKYDNLLTLIESRLDKIEVPQEKLTYLLEISKIYIEKTSTPEKAEGHLLKALEVVPGDDAARSLLVDAFTVQEKWEDLIGFYEFEIKNSRNPDLGNYIQLGMLWWKKVGDLDSAEPYFQKVMAAEPESPLVMNFFGEFYRSKGDFLRHITMLQKALRTVKPDDPRQFELAHQLTEVARETSPDKAIEVWKKIYKTNPESIEAFEALKDLYTSTEKWTQLLDLYKDEEHKIRQDDIPARVSVLFNMADLIEDRIRVDAMVVNVYNQILKLDPDNSAALDRLIDKYEVMKRWKEVITIYQQKLDNETVDVNKIKYLKKIADLYNDKLTNPNKASEPLEAVLQIDPKDMEVIGQLKDIYEKRRNWKGLFDLKLTEIEMASEDQKLPLLVDLAKFAQQPLGNMKLAIETWNMVLEIDPHDIDAMENLVFLYDREKRYPALVEMLRRKISLSMDDEALPILERAGSILTDKMNSLGSLSMELWQKVFELNPNHAKALKILKDLYAANKNWVELENLFSQKENWTGYIETLSSCADSATENDEKVSLLFKVAEIYIDKLEKPDRAVKPFERILEVDPVNREAAQKLLPIYEGASKWSLASRMYEILYHSEEKESEKLVWLDKLISLNTDNLNNPAEAFRWACEALTIVPNDDHMASRVETFAATASLWKEAAVSMNKAVETLEGKSKTALLSRLARIYVEELTELEQGEKIWREVLLIDNASGEALSGLATIYEYREDWTALIDILKEQLETVTDSAYTLQARHKMAQIFEIYLDKKDDAINLFKEILSLDDTNLKALEALDRLYNDVGNWSELEEILKTQLILADEGSAEQTNLRYRLGNLNLKNLEKPSDALDYYSIIIESTDPPHPETVQSLKAILTGDMDITYRVKSAELLAPHFSGLNQWEDYASALEVIAQFLSDANDKIAKYRELLNIVTRKVGDTGKGFDIACTLFTLDPSSEETRQELRSLSRLDDKLDELKKLYLDFIDSGIDNLRLELAWEIALLEEEDRDNREESEKFYNIVLEEDPLHEGAFLALERIYSFSERWNDLRTLYEKSIDALNDIELRKEMLFKLSHLNENMLTDIPAAIKSYSTLRELEPGNPEAFESLVRLYELSDDWENLARIYEEDLSWQTSGDAKVRFLYARCDILLHKLKRNQEAIEIIKEIIEIRKTHEGVRNMLSEMLEIPETRLESSVILAELYELDSDYEQHVKMLEIQLEFAADTHDAVQLLLKEADILTVQLGKAEDAFSALRRALNKDPHNEEVRNSIEQLAIALNSYSDLVEVWKEAITAAGDDESLKLFYTERVARIYERQLNDFEKAIEWYRRLLDAEDDTEYQARAASSLIDLYSMHSEWIEIIDLHNRQLTWVSDETERKNIFRRIALLQEDMLDSPDDAAKTHSRLLEEFPDDREALERLEIIYSRIEKWAELVDVLSRKVEYTDDSELRKSCWSRIAILREESLGEIEGAAEAWNSILLENPDDGEALRYLARLNESLERWADVYDLVEKELALTYDSEMARSLKYRLGYILQVHLEEPERAIARYREVLEEDPGHEKAKMALESMLNGEEFLALSAAGILETIYEIDDNWEKLTGLYVLKAGYSMDPREKVDLFLKIARIKENELGEPIAAFGFYGQACKEALSEPDLQDILDQLQRLASIEGRWAELVELYKTIGEDIMDGRVQESVFLTIADVSRDALSDLATSRKYYEKVLENSPENLHAMDALERVYEETSDWKALHDIYISRSELPGCSDETRYTVLVKAAKLSHEKLNDLKQATEHYNDIMMFRPEDPSIFRALEGLYFDQELWDDLISLYEQRIRYVEEIDEAVEIRFSMGEVFMDFLDDADRAIESFRAALGGNPASDPTIERIEKFLENEAYALSAAEVLVPIYAARQVWTKLINVFSLQRNLEGDPEVKSGLTKRIAELYETVLEDLEQAFVWYGYLFEEKPENHQILERLVNLAELLEKWQEVSEVFARILENSYGDAEHILQISEELARIYAKQLQRIDDAIECYKRILAADRNRDDIFRELELLLIENKKWEVLLEVYREIADSFFDPTKKNPYLYKICGVLEDQLDKNEEAIETYREILEGDPQDEKAVSALTRLYTKLAKWEELVEHISYQVNTKSDPDDIINLNLRLSELYNEKLGEPDSSVDCLENILRIDPLNDRVLVYLEKLLSNETVQLRTATILQPIYQTLDQWKQLIRVYEVLISLTEDEYQKIQYLKECSQLYDDRAQNLEKSFKALSDAWLLDINDGDTLNNLYGLALRAGNWKEYIEILEKGIKDSYDTELQVSVLLRVARIQSETLEEKEASVVSYRRILEIRDDHLDALSELASILTELEQWSELADVLDRKSELLSEPESAGETLRKLALLRMDVLEETEKAIETWRKLLDFVPMDEQALRSLERLYEKSEKWDELPEIIRNIMDIAPDERIEKAFKLSAIHETKLEDTFEAINALKMIIEEVPENTRAINDLARLYRKEENWPDLIECYEKLISLEMNDEKRNDLIFETAQVLQNEMSDINSALEKYRFILDFAPSYKPALDALSVLVKEDDFSSAAASILEPLYTSLGDDESLIKLYSELIQKEIQPEDMKRYLYNLAGLYEKTNNNQDAFNHWGRLFRIEPENQSTEMQLHRLAEIINGWKSLTELYSEITEDIYDEELKTRLMLTQSRIFELNLEQLEDAVKTLDKLVENVPTNLGVMNELDRLLIATEKWEKLSELLEMEANTADGTDEKALYQYRLGKLLNEKLDNPTEAVSAFRMALDLNPDHSDSIIALESMFNASAEVLGEVLDVLEPVYERLSRPEKLIKLYEARASLVEDATDKSAFMAKAAQTAASAGDMDSSISFWQKAFAYSPEDPTYLDEFMNTAEMAGKITLVVEAVTGALSKEMDDIASVNAAQKTAELCLRAGDTSGAEKMYGEVLRREDENITALKALEEIYRMSDSISDLVRILDRRSQVEYDPEVKKPILEEIARLYEINLNDMPRALKAWKELLEMDEMDLNCRTQLIRLYESMDYWNDLVDILGIHMNYLQEVEDIQEVRKRIARIYDEKLDKPDKAEEAWRDAFDAVPGDTEAFNQMMKIFKNRQDWDSIKDMYFTKLSMASDDDTKVETYLALANLCINSLNEPDDAADYYNQILDIKPDHDKVFDKLSEIYTAAERYYDLIEVLRKRAAYFGSVGESSMEVVMLDKIARIWEENLENGDEALKILEEILDRDGGNVTALTGLARLHENREEWEKCQQYLEKAALLEPKGSEGAELAFRRGNVALKLGDEETAIVRWQEALRLYPKHSDSFNKLKEIATTKHDEQMLVKLYQNRLPYVTEKEDRLPALLELADLYVKMGAGEAAFPYLEEATGLDPENIEVKKQLGDAYFAGGNYSQAEQIYNSLCDELAKDRNAKKDLASIYQRLGGIREGQSDNEGALDYYTKAQKLDPTYVPNLIAMAKCNVKVGNHDQGQKLFRALLFQKIDGVITKGEIFLEIARIDLLMGNAAKAKASAQRGLTEDPSNAEIKAFLEQIQ